MKCEVCQEALSARIDGEPEPVPSEQVDGHLDECPTCAQWYAAAVAATRGLRMRPVTPTPDFVDLIVERAVAEGVVPGFRDSRVERLRLLLGVIGAIQCALGIAQLAGISVGMHADHLEHAGAAHLFNESTAWNLALGIGMVYCALRTDAASGLVPILGGFTGVVALFVALDLARHDMTVARATSHLVVVAGLLVAILLRRRLRGGPEERGTEHEPVPVPDGARAGRRTDHLSRHDPAA
ncbi:zf-HC2 domain-containing protein [Nocardia sp. CDC153]|uniref:zf-HC2 domain-containing protein n=1 Tax=Nocardia sp. CDC153 TaxID=3112167 RepID=UPI002DB9A96E|nr:zf-HC2 domain-containing protein [Nocardia sp. CDC153]MEC3954117.1 zf-HC2 domain-containing protein [Nocardia sp. CDC153]